MPNVATSGAMPYTPSSNAVPSKNEVREVIPTIPTMANNGREKITFLERRMSALPQVELELSHYFKNGMYAREMRVPKGTFISGKIHSTGTIGVLSRGSMRVWGEDGHMKTVEAPYIHTAEPGFKRVGFALEDVVWITIHRTGSTDLAQIEKDEFVAEEGGVDMFDFATGALKPQHELDRQDFRTMLAEHGISAEVVAEETAQEADRIDVDLSLLGVRLGPSAIDGVGVFAERVFDPGVIVGAANFEGSRTQFGRYVNHSQKPNARMVPDRDSIFLVALNRIEPGQEITVDYRTSLEARKCLVS